MSGTRSTTRGMTKRTAIRESYLHPNHRNRTTKRIGRIDSFSLVDFTSRASTSASILSPIPIRSRCPPSHLQTYPAARLTNCSSVSGSHSDEGHRRNREALLYELHPQCDPDHHSQTKTSTSVSCAQLVRNADSSRALVFLHIVLQSRRLLLAAGIPLASSSR